jgi:hypothetical protein
LAVDEVDAEEELVFPSVAASAESASTALVPPARALVGSAAAAMAARATRRMIRKLRADMVETSLRGQFRSSVRRHRNMSSTT